MTKYEIQRLNRKIRTVNRRLKELDKSGLSNIPIVNTVRGALGGQKYFSKVNRNIGQDEFNQIEYLANIVFNDSRTTKSGARRFREGQQEMFSNMLRGVLGREVTSAERDSLMEYIPYVDMRFFLDDYIYEHVVETALDLMNAGIDYNQDYMETALQTSVQAVVAQVLYDSGVFSDEDISKGVIGDYANLVLNGYTIQEVIRKYIQDNEERFL